MKILSFFRLFAIIVFVISFGVGCALFDSTGGQTKQTSASAIQDAKAAIAKANAVNWIWRDTEKILKSAEDVAKKGEENKAIKLANEARDQALLAVKQYHLENSIQRGI